MTTRRVLARPGWALLLGLLVLIGAALLSATTGPAALAPRRVLADIADRLPFVNVVSGLNGQEQTILWELRMPRLVLGALVGAMLSLAGAAYQGVFRNPLADPYLLGVAAGAGLGATLAIGFQVGASASALVPVAAFLGAVTAVVITYVLGRTLGDRTVTSLILAGVAMASFFTALQTYVQQRNVDTIREVYSWILGRLATSGWREVRVVIPYVVVAAVVVLLHRRLLDVLSVGDEEAAALGVPVRRVRLLVVAGATLGTAAAVAVSGLIGFVGIIVPHTVRLLTGSSYRLVLPLSLLFGAAFMVATDLAARTIVSPAELPIGVVTAFFGAPFFVAILRTSRRSL